MDDTPTYYESLQKHASWHVHHHGYSFLFGRESENGACSSQVSNMVGRVAYQGKYFKWAENSHFSEHFTVIYVAFFEVRVWLLILDGFVALGSRGL
jgi:hypothetical protein